MSNQKNMNEVNKEALISTRKSLHQAVQLVSAVPRNILPKDPTDGMSSLEWNTQLKSLEALPVTNPRGEVRVGLELETFALYISVNHERETVLTMSGKSVNQGLQWLKAELALLEITPEKINLNLPYEIESYDYSNELLADDQALTTFAELYQLTAQVLAGITGKWDNVFDIRCWPHHFDLATLIPLKTDQDNEILRSIGVGLSPGDEGIAEPYLYVNIWPQVALERLEKHELSLGNWNAEGWSGAVFTYGQMIESPELTKALEEFTTTVMGTLVQETE